ncbi:MAG: hypothetical protein OXH69_17700, partial [Acidobacteria bacterium]|nr:hypothetical protein [Acidobacteriota bacterium]
MMLLCRRHHRAVHEEGFRVQVDGGGAIAFLRPDGRPLAEAPAAPDWDGPALAPVDRRLADAGVGIDAETAPRWQGSGWTSAGPSTCCGARGPAKTRGRRARGSVRPVTGGGSRRSRMRRPGCSRRSR